MHRTSLLLYSLVMTSAISTFKINSMQKQLDLKAIIDLANKDQTHQSSIETFFIQQLSDQEKHTRDLRFIYLQTSVHNQTRTSGSPEEVKQCLLVHLQLAYQKKEQAYLQSALCQCNGKIEYLIKTLEKK